MMAKMPPALSGDQFEAVHIHQSHVSDLQLWDHRQRQECQLHGRPASKQPISRSAARPAAIGAGEDVNLAASWMPVDFFSRLQRKQPHTRSDALYTTLIAGKHTLAHG